MGYCLSRLKQYAEARPWYERAVAEAEQGDVHGRVDKPQLRQMLLNGAVCLDRLGDEDRAREWRVRASEL